MVNSSHVYNTQDDETKQEINLANSFNNDKKDSCNEIGIVVFHPRIAGWSSFIWYPLCNDPIILTRVMNSQLLDNTKKQPETVVCFLDPCCKNRSKLSPQYRKIILISRQSSLIKSRYYFKILDSLLIFCLRI